MSLENVYSFLDSRCKWKRKYMYGIIVQKLCWVQLHMSWFITEILIICSKEQMYEVRKYYIIFPVMAIQLHRRLHIHFH